jgi:hypothetical protein
MYEVITRAIKSIEYLSESEKFKVVIHQHTLRGPPPLSGVSKEWLSGNL